MEKKKVIKPMLPSGFRDYMPEQMIARNYMLKIITSVFERFGFDPIETPHVERLDILTGNADDFSMQIFVTMVAQAGKITRATLDRSMQENDWALRFDHTVPLARFVAKNLDMPKPFKRYAWGSVFRGEKPGTGRFREFKQFDIDTVGVRSVEADAEIVQVMYESMYTLDIQNFLIRINNRKILNGLAEVGNFTDNELRVKEVFRALDKLEKSSWEEVKELLTRKPANELDEGAANLDKNTLDLIKNFIDIEGTPTEVLDQAMQILSKSAIAQEGIEELKTITDELAILEVPSECWTIDLAVARGLDYYTGPVFETYLLDLPGIGSIFSGGRYDKLVDRFVKDANVAATGASLGFDRFFEALVQLGMVMKKKTVTELLVADFDPDLKSEILEMTTTCRGIGICTERYFGDDNSLKGQLTYALKREIPYMLIYGSKEHEQGNVIVKDLRQRLQQTIIKKNLGREIKLIIKSAGR